MIDLLNKKDQLHEDFSMRKHMNKKVYANRVSYTTPMLKGFKLGLSYAPFALHTGSIRMIDDILKAPDDVEKEYIRNLLDVGIQYESKIGPVDFKAYFGMENAKIPDLTLQYLSSAGKLLY